MDKYFVQQIRVREVAVEDVDIVKGLCDYVKHNLVEYMVLGVSVKNGIVRYDIFI